jgi:hypothetical protein
MVLFCPQVLTCNGRIDPPKGGARTLRIASDLAAAAITAIGVSSLKKSAAQGLGVRMPARVVSSSVDQEN